MMPSKDDTARILADAHYQLDDGVVRIFRIVEAKESDDRRPVKLLEINPMTPEVGVSPVGFGADPARGVDHPSIVIELSPREFDRLQQGELSLPHDWSLGDELRRTTDSKRVAS